MDGLAYGYGGSNKSGQDQSIYVYIIYVCTHANVTGTKYCISIRM